MLRTWLMPCTSSIIHINKQEESSNVSSVPAEAAAAHQWLFENGAKLRQQYFIDNSSSAVGPADYLGWRSSCDCWWRVMLCSGDEMKAEVSLAMDDLAAKCHQISSRSYLPVGLVERVLLMLVAVFDGAQTAGRVAVQSGGQLPWLVTAAAHLAQGIAGSLTSCLNLHCACFSSPPHDSGVPGSRHVRLGLSDTAWAAAARAEVAAQATAAAAGLLAKFIAGSWVGVSGSSTCTTGAVTAASIKDAAVPSSSSPMLHSLLQLQGSLVETANWLTEQLFVAVMPPMEPHQHQAALSQAAAVEQARAMAVKVRIGLTCLWDHVVQGKSPGHSDLC
jgi:hypothetical protein